MGLAATGIGFGFRIDQKERYRVLGVVAPFFVRDDRLRFGWLNGRGTARSKDSHGSASQGHITPNLLVYENERLGFKG